MKTFETPVVDVKKFDVMDVLTVSGGESTEETFDLGAIIDPCL